MDRVDMSESYDYLTAPQRFITYMRRSHLQDAPCMPLGPLTRDVQDKPNVVGTLSIKAAEGDAVICGICGTWPGGLRLSPAGFAMP